MTETAAFAIKLEDETSDAADDAADSLEKLREKVEAGRKELRAMQAMMRDLKSATTPNAALIKDLTDKIAAQKQEVAAASASYLEMGGSFKSVAKEAKSLEGDLEKTKKAGKDAKKGAKDAKSGLDGLLDTSSKMPGPLGALASRLNSLKGAITASPPMMLAAAFAAVGTAAVALAASLAVATAALLSYGLAQANARRSELLRLEGLTTLRRHQGLAAGSATEMQAAIDRVSASSSLSRDQIVDYASQLYRMRLRGAAAEQALRGMATVGAAQGDQFARRFAGMAAGAARTGHSVRALADDVEARLGGLARRHLLDWDVQMEKLNESFSSLFSDLRIDGLLQRFHELTQLFSQNTASGRALKAIVETLFQPMINGVETVAPLAKRFFQGMVIAALRLVIVFLRVRNGIMSAFGGSSVLGAIDTQRMAVMAGAAVVALFVSAIGAAVVIVTALAAAIGIVVAGVAVFAAPFIIASAAIAGIVIAGIKLYEWFQSVDWSELGSSLASGLVRGLLHGRDLLIRTVRGLAADATRALTSALDIHSPSRVFAKLGVQIPRGLAGGVDSGAPAVEQAVDSMVPVPSLSAEPDAQSGAGARGATTIAIDGGIHVHMQGGDSPRDVAQSIKDELIRLLEGVAITMGAPA